MKKTMRNLLVLILVIVLVLHACTNGKCYKTDKKRTHKSVPGNNMRKQVSKFHLNGIWSRIGKRNGQSVSIKQQSILERLSQYDDFYI